MEGLQGRQAQNMVPGDADAVAVLDDDDSDLDGWEDDFPDGVPENAFALNEGLTQVYEQDDAIERDDDADPFDAGDTSTGTPSIDEGDFVDPAQHFLFLALKKRAREACNVNSKKKTRQRALEWIYVPGTRDVKGVDFDHACRALGSRPGVVRARIAHQLWKASIMVEPLPFLSAMPPSSLMSEISAMVGPGAPEKVAREAWFWPSVPATELLGGLVDSDKKSIHLAIDSLVAAGYLAITSGRVYFISRNPTMMSANARARFCFSEAIHGE